MRVQRWRDEGAEMEGWGGGGGRVAVRWFRSRIAVESIINHDKRTYTAVTIACIKQPDYQRVISERRYIGETQFSSMAESHIGKWAVALVAS